MVPVASIYKASGSFGRAGSTSKRSREKEVKGSNTEDKQTLESELPDSAPVMAQPWGPEDQRRTHAPARVREPAICTWAPSSHGLGMFQHFWHGEHRQGKSPDVLGRNT